MASIPKALREQLWLKYNGKRYTSGCYIRWCRNDIDVFNYHIGHNVPQSKGGGLNLENLRPICSRCNLSMSNIYTIDEWQLLGNPIKKSWLSCFTPCCEP